MNKTINIILIVVAALAVAIGIFFAGAMYTRSITLWTNWTTGAYGWNNTAYSPIGMMSGAFNRGRGGFGTMMSGAPYSNTNSAPLTTDQAKAATKKYLANLNNSDLQIAEIMIFNNNAYVVVKEASTGIGAFELLVDPVSQIAYPEYGPNMMWNLKYGSLNHNGMMNGWNYQYTNPASASANMPVTKDQATKIAQSYLDQYQPGAVAATDPMQFYGYYTLDFSKDGKVAGMLSVNGYSGQVFLHTWHGAFIEEAQVQ
ncbi:MAG TPA: hypothetical protein VIN60_06220 [Anaerolineales bacterium]